MPARLLIARFACLLLFSVWLGGFTFYSAAVIPALHDAMPSPEAGRITQRVTDRLNGLGAATLILWWAAGRWEAGSGPLSSRRRRAKEGLLTATTLLLLALFLMHRIMDARLAADHLDGFYPLHRVYLIASTIQWLVNLALMALAIASWSTPPHDRSGPGGG
jgi:hypothetical protein